MQFHASIAFLVLSLSGSACGSSKPPPPTPAPATQPAHDEGGMVSMCPMKVPGTQVSASDTADGIAIAFSTSGDVAQLRERVHHMAAMHEKMMSGETMGSGGMMGSGAMSGGMMGSGGMGSGGMMKMVPSKARAEDIDGGARIVLTPNDPAQLAALRDHVHHHAEMMKKDGECPMMHGGA